MCIMLVIIEIQLVGSYNCVIFVTMSESVPVQNRFLIKTGGVCVWSYEGEN